MVSLFLLLGCNLSYIVYLFAGLHELASASARTLLILHLLQKVPVFNGHLPLLSGWGLLIILTFMVISIARNLYQKDTAKRIKTVDCKAGTM